MDKRVVKNERVKKEIEKALFTLLERKRFSEITVSDIIRTSGVARASYYRNFDSKEDVIESYMERQRREVAYTITFSESLADTSIGRYNLYFLSGAMFNTTIQWLKGGAVESPREMAHAFLHLLSSNNAELD